MRSLRKYYLITAALLVSLLFAFTYFRTVAVNYDYFVERFNERFIKIESNLDKILDRKATELENDGLDNQWEEIDDEGDVFIHIYQNDSLKFWNTNQLPIIRFADIHFPSDGVIHLQNGWYYAKTRQLNNFIISVAFLVKRDFTYENKDLINDFANKLHVPFEASIAVAEEQGYPVNDQKGAYLFSIIPTEDQPVSYWRSMIVMTVLIMAIILWLLVLVRLKARLKSRLKWLIPVAVLLLRALALYFDWFNFLGGTVALDPSVYGSSALFPTFFDYLLNIAILLYLLSELGTWVKNNRKKRWITWITLFLLSATIFLYWALIYLLSGLVDNSSISLEIGEIFSLDILSLVAIVSLGIYFYFLFQFILKLLDVANERKIQASHLAVGAFILGCCYFVYEIYFGHELLSAALFPFIYYGAGIYISYRNSNSKPLATGILVLLFFASTLSFSLGEFNQRKERSEREVFASQLVTEKSIVTEVEYAILAKKLAKDKLLKKIIASPIEMSMTDFQENMERRFFNGFWERYEMQFNLLDENHLPIIDKRKEAQDLHLRLHKIIEESGKKSEIDSSIYFIDDYTDQYSYIIQQKIKAKDSTTGILVCSLKSKKIPEEIGFPRLLISSKANVLESLEEYSIAKFHKNRLVTRYGDFNYPSSYQIMLPKKVKSEMFFDFGGYNHYLLKKSDYEVVILSTKLSTWVDQLTRFSYLFCFYGLLLFPLLFQTTQQNSSRKTLTLAMKIQLMLFTLVFLSLLTFGWGSGVFVRDQYNELPAM